MLLFLSKSVQMTIKHCAKYVTVIQPMYVCVRNLSVILLVLGDCLENAHKSRKKYIKHTIVGLKVAHVMTSSPS